MLTLPLPLGFLTSSIYREESLQSAQAGDPAAIKGGHRLPTTGLDHELLLSQGPRTPRNCLLLVLSLQSQERAAQCCWECGPLSARPHCPSQSFSRRLLGEGATSPHWGRLLSAVTYAEPGVLVTGLAHHETPAGSVRPGVGKLTLLPTQAFLKKCV